MAGKSIKKVKVDKYRLISLFERFNMTYKDIGALCNRGASSIGYYLQVGEMPRQVAIDIAKGLSIELCDISPDGFETDDLGNILSVLSEYERDYLFNKLQDYETDYIKYILGRRA